MPLSELTPELIAVQVFTGIALGAVYILLAIGLSLIFGMLGVVNFAHGAFFTLGAYAGLAAYQATGSFVVALLAGPLCAGLVGLLAERFLVRPLYSAGPDYPLLATFGLAYVLVEIIRICFGRVGLPFPQPEALQGAADIGIGYFPKYRLFVILFTAAVVTGLYLFIEKTRLGLIIRAGARDATIVRILGFNISAVWLTIFGLGTALAGLAGVLAAPLQGVTPEMGNEMLIDSFVVTVIGGMGSLAGAVVAGLLVGVLVSMAALIAPETAQVSMFALMALVLLFRPQGLVGRAGRSG